jgi:hypothetical protein
VAIDGDHAYVADWSAGLQIIDISDPMVPAIVASVDAASNVEDVAIDGTQELVSASYGGLEVVDITSPTEPQRLGSVGTGLTWSAMPYGAHVCVAVVGGLRSVNLANLESPMVLARLATSGSSRDVAIDDRWAYVACYADGLEIVDVSDPAAPETVADIAVEGLATKVAVSNGLAAVADETGGGPVQFFDITDPASPSPLGQLATTGIAQALAIEGDRAYVADHLNGLLVVDVSDPTAPTITGSVLGGSGTIPRGVQGLNVDGTRAYLCYAIYPGPGGGLQVIDLTTPSTPTVIGSLFITSWSPAALVLRGTELYVSSLQGPVHAIDVSDPTAPVVGTSVDLPGQSIDISARGTHAYVASTRTGAHVIDISHPARIELIGGLTTDGRALGVAAGDEAVFVVADEEGLYVLAPQCP